MFTTKQIESISVTIPSLGECTLLPFAILPEKLRNYEKLLGTAKGLDLEELPSLSRLGIQEIFKVLAYTFSERGVSTTESIAVLLGEPHDAYPKIDITDKNQKMERCVLTMEFFFWEESCLSKGGNLTGGPVDMQLDEVPINEFIPILGDDNTYCLFLGT